MKTICIPKGQTVVCDTLETERLMVNGCLKVAHGLKAKVISGSGVIFAGNVSADDIHVREMEAISVYCLRLNAKQVCAEDVFASESAVVSCYLCAGYVAATRLTVALYKVAEMDAGEVVSLPPAKKAHPFWMLLATVLRPFQVMLSVFRSTFCMGEVLDAEYRQASDDTVHPAV